MFNPSISKTREDLDEKAFPQKDSSSADKKKSDGDAACAGETGTENSRFVLLLRDERTIQRGGSRQIDSLSIDAP